MRRSLAIGVTDPSGASEARRGALALSARLGFDEKTSGRAAIVVSEIATNVFKHAGAGEVLLTAIEESGAALQVLGLDNGRGFDAEAGLRDGYSTAGTPGTGLGAIRRLSDLFDLYSRKGQGSAVLAEVRRPGEGRRAPPDVPVHAGLAVPAPGEEACGDAWAVRWTGEGGSVLLADGLGHGPAAEFAAREAVAAFEGSAEESPAALIARLHEALRPTRGAAVAIAQVQPAARRVVFAGVGNIGAAIVSAGKVHRLVSHNGTAGHELRRLQEFEYAWAPGARLILASDGLATRWDPTAYPGALDLHPAILAGLLYRDFSRRRDDASVVVVADRALPGGAA